ncbi:hypothetical protein CGZ88_1215 [Bifidobacterium anseris]|uniref:Uncharacterized protein n=1 Tax=Bifidobacterium anseris TaxID=2020963 RepID=A0A2N5IXR2_9BIFI|nr:hypothetical protein CGZ88_1215 [Bifidobacterium anseris]
MTVYGLLHARIRCPVSSVVFDMSTGFSGNGIVRGVWQGIWGMHCIRGVDAVAVAFGVHYDGVNSPAGHLTIVGRATA